MLDLAPTTELEAVNDMLDVIGEAPIATLDETLADAQRALNLLRRENRAVQAEGWHFNTDENLKLTPDIDGNIALPLGTLKVDTVGDSASVNVTNRGGKLYDVARQSFNFSAYPTLYVDLTVLLAFTDLPEIARTYIRVRAGRKFLARTIGSQDAVGYEASDEKLARATLEAEEETNADRSIFDSPAYAGLMYGRRPGRWA